MAAGKKHETAPDAWLIEGLDSDQDRRRRTAAPASEKPVAEATWEPEKPGAEATREPEKPGAETSEWLAIPSPDRSRKRPQEEKGPPPEGSTNGSPDRGGEVRRERQPRVRRIGLSGRLAAQRDRRLNAKLRGAQLTIESQKEKIAELRGRIEQLEAELEAASVLARPPATKKVRRRSTDSPGPSSTQVKLNDATFEQLRGLGLSITQSARLIAYRDTRGGYESIDELDGIPGFPRENLADLKRGLRM